MNERYSKIVASLGWELGLALLATLLMVTSSQARTWRVTAAGTGDAPTIQAAVDSARVGDDVLLAAGLYSWMSQQPPDVIMVSVARSLWIHSDAGASATVVDLDYRGRGFALTTPGTRLRMEGLTIRNGSEAHRGVGVFAVEGTVLDLLNCAFENNGSSEAGGGGGVSGDSVFVQNCVFARNRGPETGAVFASVLKLRWCQLIGNSAHNDGGTAGGAAYGWRQADVRNCEFRDNTATDFKRAYGGALAGGSLIVDSCVFFDNVVTSATFGSFGGAVAGLGAVEISNCVFVENRAGLENVGVGGAVFSQGPLTMRNCTLISNAVNAGDQTVRGFGGALTTDAGGTVEQCTFVGNQASTADGFGGIYSTHGGLVVANCILASTAVGVVCGGTPGPTFRCCAFFANSAGDMSCGTDGGGNFSADPQFCATNPLQSHNVTLQSDSPCAPGQHPDGTTCGLIGALPIGCAAVHVRQKSWSDVKSIYR